MMDVHLQASEIVASKLPLVATEEYWKNDAPICGECFTGGIWFDVMKENAGLHDYHSGYLLESVPVSEIKSENV